MDTTPRILPASELLVEDILHVFRSFSAISESKDHLQTKLSTAYEGFIRTTILNSQNSGRPIKLLLPAFPWKNPNLDKVLSGNADFGEELGLARLDHLCTSLAQIYPMGVELTLVSDGPVYNDLLGIPDSDFYDYGLQLRQMAKEKGCTHIKFTRLFDVLGLGDGDSLSKKEYLVVADVCRQEMEKRLTLTRDQLQAKIENDPDTLLTYQQYVKSAFEDLRWGPEVDPVIKASPAKYESETQEVAKRMMQRLLAYEQVLSSRFPDHIRLSIHRSTGASKISIPLIPQPDEFGMMPWHSCVLVRADGRFQTGHSSQFRDTEQFEIISRGSSPYLVREKHPMFSWNRRVEISHAYGGFVTVTNLDRDEKNGKLDDDSKGKLVDLALRFGTIQLRGFDIS
ncbi:hypothetical protein PFICI_08075 [Pestalotiopsis fici W106-1]|uniref:Pyoverdine/dityrosine biosynthesis protein n=1 Tax=Pestalotiopsis fici (strain W106-1 / CGMCC3.15140) TaxID=1229662 RepID=W3X5T8_PESFW|nr:uncharacterized protein PFICI_08075 [Pestalotiopsis fici W106-1]ETS80546.1 hypothetical protein PFICI_08075 [Pestalotiopsis fici W106-1]